MYICAINITCNMRWSLCSSGAIAQLQAMCASVCETMCALVVCCAMWLRFKCNTHILSRVCTIDINFFPACANFTSVGVCVLCKQAYRKNKHTNNITILITMMQMHRVIMQIGNHVFGIYLYERNVCGVLLYWNIRVWACKMCLHKMWGNRKKNHAALSLPYARRCGETVWEWSLSPIQAVHPVTVTGYTNTISEYICVRLSGLVKPRAGGYVHPRDHYMIRTFGAIVWTICLAPQP